MKCQVRGCSNKVSAAWEIQDIRGNKITRFICHRCLRLVRYNLIRARELEHSYRKAGISFYENR